MTIAGRARATLNWGIWRNRVGARIALITVVERHGHFGLCSPGNNIGNAIGEIRPEVGMQKFGGPVHVSDVVPGIGIYRVVRNVAVPRIVGWKHRASGDLRTTRDSRKHDGL